MTVPAFLPYYVIGGAVAVIAVILAGLQSALWKAKWPKEARRSALLLIAFILIGWFALAAALGWQDVYHGASDRIPTIQYGILAPILIGILLMWRSQTISCLLDAIPQSWIIGIQFYRALGGIFLVLYAMGKAPAPFAWPAGAGDMITGLLAPVVGALYASDPRKNAGRVLAWNVFGIADLVVAVTAGFMTAPSPFQLLALDAPNELVGMFPLVLIPVYVVPLSILLHIASLAKLRRAHYRSGVTGDLSIARA